MVLDCTYVRAEDRQVVLVDRDDDSTVEREPLSTASRGTRADRLLAGSDNDTLADGDANDDGDSDTDESR